MNKSPLRVVLVGTQKWGAEVGKWSCRVDQVSQLRQLTHLLIENDVDLIVADGACEDFKKIFKVSRAYFVPLVQVGGSSSKSDGVWPIDSIEKISDLLSDKSVEIENFQLQRQVQKKQWVLETLTKFTDQTLHTRRDLFIAETKNFFKKNFRIKTCRWVSVSLAESGQPAILQLKQQLKKQPVDQGTLIQALEDCTDPLATRTEFQLWKKAKGGYLCLMWIHQVGEDSQCIILDNWVFADCSRVIFFLGYLSSFLQRRWHLCGQLAAAERQIYHDSLTSLYNQKFLEQVLHRKIEENKRYKTPFSVLFIDVDHFKRVNDSLGHLVGSGVLKEMAEILKEQIRTSDFAFRYGGDEFIILLSHTEGKNAMQVADRIRKEVEKTTFVVNDKEVKVTVSIGLAFYPQHAQSSEDIIRIADEAMYYGKHKGRNIVYKAS